MRWQGLRSNFAIAIYGLAFVLACLFTAIIFTSSAHASESYNAKVKCLAANIYHEARGEGIRGMLAVGQVTMNRVHDNRWPPTVCGVVLQPKQFSWTAHPKPIYDQAAWHLSLRIASMLLSGYSFQLRATNYVAVWYRRHVAWVYRPDMKPVARIGKHQFYRQLSSTV